jgi:hypothetical protein
VEKVILKQLDGFDLYDLPVISIEIDIIRNTYKFVFEEYDDLKSKPAPLTLTFSNVSLFKIDNVNSNLDLLLVACRETRCEQITDSAYQIQFIMEQEQNTLGVILTLIFSSLEIDRTLSPLAIEYKNTHFDSRMDERVWLEKHCLNCD